MKKIFNIIKIVFLFIIILFMVFFSISNSELVRVNFDIYPFKFSFEMRVFLLIIFCFSVGFLMGIITTSLALLKKNIHIFMHKNKANKLEKQLNNINNKVVE